MHTCEEISTHLIKLWMPLIGAKININVKILMFCIKIHHKYQLNVLKAAKVKEFIMQIREIQHKEDCYLPDLICTDEKCEMNFCSPNLN